MANEFINPEITALDRQRKMAQMLVQQGMQTPQGQMIGNQYVPVNPMQFIGNLFQQYAGQKGLENIDEKELTLAKALRQKDLEDLQAGMRLYQGAPEKTTELAGPAYEGVSPTAVMPAQAPNPQAAMALLLGSQGPKSSAVGADLYKQMFKEPKWEKSELPDANGNVKVGWVNVNSQNPLSTFVLGGTKPDVEQAKGKWEGYLPQSGGFGPSSAAGNSSFAPAMAKVFGFEGDAYVAKDGLSGAPSKFGINQKFNPDIDVKNLTKPQAEAIYKTRYWDAIGGDTLPPKTAEIAFDAAVNQGPNYAKELIAKTGGDPSKMLQQRAQDYTKLVQSNPAQAQFLPSWMNRLSTLAKDIVPEAQASQTPQFKTKAEQDAWLTGQRKTAELKAEAQNALPAALQTAEMGLTTINKLIGDTTVDEKGNIVRGKTQPHPGFEGSVGISGLGTGFGTSGYLPGTDVSNFKSKFKQLEGQAFLQAINSLRGTGAISEKEGASATAAITDMSLSQSEKEFVKSANELRTILQKGYTAAQQRAGAEPSTPNAKPSSGNTPKLRWNPQTNSFVQ